MTTGTLIEFVRFGYGPAPQDLVIEGGVDGARLLGQLTPAGPQQPTGAATRERLVLLAAQHAASVAAKAGGPKTNEPLLQLRALAAQDVSAWVWDAVTTPTGFAERLVNFWANRLSIAWRKGPVSYLLGPYRDEAIRPHLAGRYADMLAASAWHPAMLEYLDQAASIGPGSALVAKTGRSAKADKGLNENYAREFLELHSMETGYDQGDVTELARLFAGMRHNDGVVIFDAERAEPGQKIILGMPFDPGRDEIARLIATVARRPETAQSVARALARQFIADDPPQDLVASMAAAYLAEDTALLPVYAVMLAHPAAADPQLRKLRTPHDYVVASIRALGLPADLASGKGRLKTSEALGAMGQPPFRPAGPDGWSDQGADWLTAPMLAARLNWAERLADRFGATADPVALAGRVLGADEADTVQAVGRAEQRWEGLAVLLGAPAFMRR